MSMNRFLIRFFARICLCIVLLAQFISLACAYEDSTLYNGCRGDSVRTMQEALISLGYLKGTADGIFGNNTENAVRKFQKKNKLTPDGLAGEKTLSMILSQSELKQSSSSKKDDTAKSSESSAKNQSSSSSSAQLNGNYATLRQGSKGERVKAMQQALISLGYLSGSADGVFGSQTRKAVISFQKARNLSADGVAGKKTLAALETAVSGGTEQKASAPASSASETENSASEGDLNDKVSGPAASSVQLLHWYNIVKPSLSSGQKLLVYDPSSGYSWTLRVLSRGRHCDAEPLTAKDTRTMIKAFGGVNTWNQKAVYVRLPDGRWSLASTHDMPHDSGTIKDNDFNGHLCVHFLRDMDEAKKNDPNYGVANQETIRSWWKKITGETIP